MSVFSSETTKLFLPRNIADGIIKDTITESTVAKLSGSEPQKFGEVDYIVFNEAPRAQYVGEGAQKSASTASWATVTAKPRKAQVTLRFNEEVQWADEDYQLSILSELGNAGATALSRALDLGLYHRIQPTTGQAITDWTNYLTATTNKVTLGSTPADDALRSAIGLLVNSTRPKHINGIALDPGYGWLLANTKNDKGELKYPTLGFGTDITSFFGTPVAIGDTVSARPEAADTGVRAIVGDFQNGIRWAIQRNIPIELIRYGDPDGQGDLKGRNQIALRLEIVYGWYVFTDRFALVTTTPEVTGGDLEEGGTE